MQAIVTVALTLDVPDGTDLDSLYLELPTDQIEVLSLLRDQPVDATVLRKGKRETVKGMKLPDAPASPFPGFPGGLPPNFPNLPKIQPVPLPPPPVPVPNPPGAANARLHAIRI